MQTLISEEQVNAALEQHLRYSGATRGSGAPGFQHLSCVFDLFNCGGHTGERAHTLSRQYKFKGSCPQ